MILLWSVGLLSLGSTIFFFLFTSFKIANSGYIFGYKLRRKTKNTRTYLFYIEKTKLEKIEKPKLKY